MRSIARAVVVWVLTVEARAVLRRARPLIIGVTGSVGKTSTKDAIYTVIKQFRHARKSEKSYNSELGVPLAILGLESAWQNPWGWIKNIVDGFLTVCFIREYPEVLVLEMGVDRPGDMKDLISWIQIDIAVITRLADVPVHVEFFNTPDDVADEELQLLSGLKESGVLIFNNDDERARRARDSILQHAISYGRYSAADVIAKQDVVDYDEAGTPIGITFTLEHEHAAHTISFRGGLGVTNTYTSAAAVAVARALGIKFDNAVAAVEKNRPTPGRMNLIPGIKGSTIIDDSYNSSPIALERAIQTLGGVHASRKIAVIGDMLELGRYSVDAHIAAGGEVANVADILITVGVRARKVAEGALKAGMSEHYIYQYDLVERAGTEFQNRIQQGDVILVKGSQGVRLEKLVKEIMSHPETADTTLVRQDTQWST